MKIAIVTPDSRGGVSDYTNEISSNLSIESTSKIFSLNKISKNKIFDQALANDCIYLQYSGYGYAKRGAPLWLLKKIKKERSKIKKIGVFFHELYASGPVTSSAFWLSPMQRYITRRLAESSDFWITNREASAQWLRKYAGDKPHAVLPVFSNVGEISTYSPERLARIIVFGSATLRSATYHAAGDTLFSWAREQQLELHDIGPIINDLALSVLLKKAGVIQHGRLESDEVSKLLSAAMFGVIVYPIDFSAKSGVLAAYCAHGICPVLISKINDPVDGLIAGTNYLAGIPNKAIPKKIIQNIGSAAWNWYQPHRIMEHIETLNRLSIEAKLIN